MTRPQKIGLGSIILLCIMGWVFFTALKEKPESENTFIPIKLYHKEGFIGSYPFKIWSDTVLISSNTATIDISSAEFKHIHGIHINGLKSSSTATTMPLLNVENYTLDTINVKMYRMNGSLVSILGFSVLTGAASTDYTSPSDIWAIITVCGY